MGRAEPFYHALAALLFAAACAWCLAALYPRLNPAEAAAPIPESPSPARGRVRGLILRREEVTEAFASVPAGTRLSAGETKGESALVYPGCDGWENLRPADAERLTPARLEEIFAAGAEMQEGARLVYGFTLTAAVLYEGEAAPQPGALRIELEDGERVEAQLLSVSTDALGRRALILRLTAFPEKFYCERFFEGEIVE